MVEKGRHSSAGAARACTSTGPSTSTPAMAASNRGVHASSSVALVYPTRVTNAIMAARDGARQGRE